MQDKCDNLLCQILHWVWSTWAWSWNLKQPIVYHGDNWLCVKHIGELEIVPVLCTMATYLNILTLLLLLCSDLCLELNSPSLVEASLPLRLLFPVWWTPFVIMLALEPLREADSWTLRAGCTSVPEPILQLSVRFVGLLPRISGSLVLRGLFDNKCRFESTKHHQLR